MAIPTPDGFTLKPVANRTVGGLVGSNTLGMILHVQAGNGALSGWFDNPAAQASSTWWGGKAGEREQYGNPDTDKFWAQAGGNPDYHSIETEGQPSEPLTDAQLDTVAVAYAWGHTRYGWPFQLAEKPGDRGLGWHGMGGKAWGGHTGCPGDIRKAQRPEILRRAQALITPTPTGGFLMALTDQQQTDLYNRVMGGIPAGDARGAKNPDGSPAWLLSSADGSTLRGDHARILAAIQALASGLGPAVEAAVAKALAASYDATLTLSRKGA